MFRPTRPFLIAALLITATSATAQLNGTYTVGTAGNYATFTAAVAALTTSGVSGPVVFNVFSGTYTEQLSIGNITGASATNTITFQSQALDSMAVVLEHPSQATNVDDWAVRLNGGDYVTFRKMTIRRSGNLEYGAVVQVATGSINFRFENCRLLPSTANTNTQYREAVRINSNTIGSSVVDRCAIDYGSGLSASFTSSGNIAFTNNVITNSLVGVYLYTTTIPASINSNRIDARNTGASRGMLLNTVSGAIQIRGNSFQGANTTYAGIYFNALNGTVGTPVRIENNSIIATGSILNGVGTTGGTSNYLDFFHNSICMSSTGGAFTMVLGNGVGNRISNNVFYCANSAALRVDPASRVSASDNNVIRHGVTFGVQWGLAWYYSISTLFTATARNGNSLFADPLFVNNASDLHLQSTSPCLGAGQLIAAVTDDVDGQARPQPVATNPDVGADERPEQCAGLNGTYIIGPSVAADHASFTSAVSALVNCGISAPVTFLVESGTYTEQISIPDIVGSSATNTITFRSQALDSTAVQLTWPSSTAAASDYTLQLNGVDRITFDRITIARSGSNNYANVVDYAAVSNAPGSQFTRFTRCRLSGTTSASPTNGSLITTSTNAINDSIRIDQCRFERGGYGIYWNNFSLGEKLLVENNEFVDQAYAGARLSITWYAFTFRHNLMTGTLPGARGLEVSGCLNSFNVHNNRILVDGNALVLSASGNAGSQPHVFNNSLISTAASGAVISVGCINIWFDHNSIQAAVYGVHFGAGTNTISSFRNNAIRSGNYTVYRQTATTSITFGSHCALRRSTVGPLAFWVSAQNTLASLQAASGRFASSVVVDPLYYNSASDLHAYAMELDLAGTPIAFVTTDIDGELRHATTPDIGADEFQPLLWNEAFNTCGAADPITSTGTGTDQWIYKDRKVVARFNDNGQTLGLVSMNVYVHNGAVRQSVIGQRYMDRNWHLTTQNAITSGAIVRLFHSGDEFTTYATADPVVNVYADAGVAHYVGLMEDCNLPNNPAGNIWTPIFPAAPALEPRIQGNGGTHGYTAVLANDGELYITTMGLPLPVELIAFTGERESDREVALRWSTATENNNAGFEVWRMIEGEAEFTQVGHVTGAGNSQNVVHYELMDANTANKSSYYQLKQVDFDGQHEWSLMIAVEGASTTVDIVLYPNPAKDEFFIQSDRGAWSTVRLVEPNGRITREWSPDGRFDLTGLPAGAYVVIVTRSDGSLAHQRLVLSP